VNYSDRFLAGLTLAIAIRAGVGGNPLPENLAHFILPRKVPLKLFVHFPRVVGKVNATQRGRSTCGRSLHTIRIDKALEFGVFVDFLQVIGD